jgi:uncharacterized membrane protein HdeD (DUF308 family)
MNSVETQLATVLSCNRWLHLLRGLIAIVFGVWAWLQPEISLAALVFFFGAYTLADGILEVWTSIAGRTEHEHWWVRCFGDSSASVSGS